MSELLIVSLFLLVIASILAVTSTFAVIKPSGKVAGHIDINIPGLGTLKTNYLALGVAAGSLLLSYFVFGLWKDQPRETINVAGTVRVDPTALTGIDAVVVGMTSSPWNQTMTLNSEGELNLTIPVPKTWNSYTAYAFAYGGGRVRPAVVGVNLGDPKFALELKP